ncbi:uncharacterized protein LODBEIA_P03630 [Lodderomyces beijingensis]|uniref:Autophagy-related protein 13 n=1 Tax=Lodderomyces beijingensis TaxID=1775926 RepID=A0ABP0ZE36_9ASCO
MSLSLDPREYQDYLIYSSSLEYFATESASFEPSTRAFHCHKEEDELFKMMIRSKKTRGNNRLGGTGAVYDFEPVRLERKRSNSTTSTSTFSLHHLEMNNGGSYGGGATSKRSPARMLDLWQNSNSSAPSIYSTTSATSSFKSQFSGVNPRRFASLIFKSLSSKKNKHREEEPVEAMLPPSPTSYETRTSFEIDDDDGESRSNDDHTEANLSSRSDTTSVFSNRGQPAQNEQQEQQNEFDVRRSSSSSSSSNNSSAHNRELVSGFKQNSVNSVNSEIDLDLESDSDLDFEDEELRSMLDDLETASIVQIDDILTIAAHYDSSSHVLGACYVEVGR